MKHYRCAENGVDMKRIIRMISYLHEVLDKGSRLKTNHRLINYLTFKNVLVS